MGVGVFCAGKRGWVGREIAFFICFGMSGHHLPHPKRSLYTPPVEPPAPSTPGRTAQHRQQHRPCKTRHTRPGTGHAAPVCTRYQTGHTGTIGAAAGLDCLRSVSETEQKRTRQNLKNKYAKKSKYLLTFTQESV